MKKQLYILILWLIPLISNAQISDKLTISKQDIRTEKLNGYDKINWKSDFQTKEVGNPELPIYRVSYVLPIDVMVTDITFTTKIKQKHQQNFSIIPVQQSVIADNSNTPAFTQPNKAVYQSTSPYPNKLYEIESDRFYMGYHLITLRIYPFEYIPLTQTLNYYTQLEFIINYTSGANKDEISPLTQNLHRAEQCKSLVQSMVKNPDDVEKFGSNVQTIRDGKKNIQNLTIKNSNSTLQKTKSLSVLDEQVPDYIIITNNALKPTFQTLADWKTKKGVFTIIETTENIDANYQGTDIQEKIRNYIIESWRKWGDGLFVLLGGGKNIVPPRMVEGDVVYDMDPPLDGNENILYPNDMYYATYKNNWNYNLNNVYKEQIYSSNGVYSRSYYVDVDKVDFTLSGIFLGRIPVDNVSEASTMVGKIINYEKANIGISPSYVQNHLYADYFSGAGVKSYITNTTSNIVKKVMVPNASGNDIEFNHDNFFNALNEGLNMGKIHFVYHMDHGSSQAISTSSEKKQGVSKSEMGSLTNGAAYQIFMSGSCHSANFTEDCVANYYLKNPLGGGVAYIGNTDWGLSSDDQQLKPFLSSIFNEGTYYTSGRYDLGQAFHAILNNSTIISYNNYYLTWHPQLLGDPEMQLWTKVPDTLNVTVGTPVVSLGEQEAAVTISNIPSGQKAMICLQKGTEVYVPQEVSGNGTYYFPFVVKTPGVINVTVTAHNFIPKEKTIQVQSTDDPYPFVESIDLSDGISGVGVGNGNGKNDAGETIEIALKIKNNGVNTLDNATVTLCDFQPYITFTNQNSCNSYNIGTLNSGESTFAYFNYTINKKTPEILSNAKTPITLGVMIADENNYSWAQNFNIDVFKDSIIQGNKTIIPIGHTIVPNETVTFNIDLENIGQALATGLTAVLTSTSPSNIIQSCSGASRTYPTLAQFETKTNNSTFQFTTGSGYTSNSQLNFNLQVTNAYGKTWNFPFNLMDKPGEVTKVENTSDVAEIDLTWPTVTNATGYNIYRCNANQVTETEVGNYVKLNNTPVVFCYYNDTKNLGVLTKYFYKVAAVSASGNEGSAIRALKWTSYPHKNLYPVTMDADVGCFNSPFNVADVNYDGKKEIFVATNNGATKSRLVALDYYGNELNNIDDNVTTKVGFSIIGKKGAGSPAIADTRRDGKFKLIEPTRDETYQATGNNSTFCYSFDDNNSDSQPDLDWSYTPQERCYRGAVVANIDNSADGSMETIICTETGTINIFSSNGALLRTIATCANYGAIAVADLTGDGPKQIIKACDDGIYIWNNDGNPYQGVTPPYYKLLANSGYSFKSSVVVCNIDNLGNKEILTSALKIGGAEGKIYAIRTDVPQSLVTNWVMPTIPYENAWHTQELAVGNLNNDPTGKLEIVALGSNVLKIWDNTGVELKSIDIPVPPGLSPGRMAPILADVDLNHNDVEIIFGSGSSSSSTIYAYKMTGEKVLGFPMKGSDGNTLCVADIDNDQNDIRNELVSTGSGCGQVSMWQTNGIPSHIEWGSERHDQYNTGEYQTVYDPTIITTNTTWNANQSVNGDLIVKSGTLTINNNINITLGSSSMIIVMAGASLVIDSGHMLNANVRAMSGSNVTVKNNGSITLRSNAEFYTEIGTATEIQYGSIDK